MRTPCNAADDALFGAGAGDRMLCGHSRPRAPCEQGAEQGARHSQQAFGCAQLQRALVRAADYALFMESPAGRQRHLQTAVCT